MVTVAVQVVLLEAVGLVLVAILLSMPSVCIPISFHWPLVWPQYLSSQSQTWDI